MNDYRDNNTEEDGANEKYVKIGNERYSKIFRDILGTMYLWRTQDRVPWSEVVPALRKSTFLAQKLFKAEAKARGYIIKSGKLAIGEDIFGYRHRTEVKLLALQCLILARGKLSNMGYAFHKRKEVHDLFDTEHRKNVTKVLNEVFPVTVPGKQGARLASRTVNLKMFSQDTIDILNGRVTPEVAPESTIVPLEVEQEPSEPEAITEPSSFCYFDEHSGRVTTEGARAEQAYIEYVDGYKGNPSGLATYLEERSGIPAAHFQYIIEAMA